MTRRSTWISAAGTCHPGPESKSERPFSRSAASRTVGARSSRRYGLEALRFVNSKAGYALNLRGVNTRVVRGGADRAGDAVRKLPSVR